MTKQEDHVRKQVLDTLESYEQLTKEEHLDREAAFERVKELFGNVKMVDAGYDDEFAFVTEEMSEGDYEKAAAQLDGVINKIRVDQTGLA